MGNNTSIQNIIRVTDYIEENIKEKLSLDQISRDIGLSKFHLNRIFKTITDKTLMDYVRNRKLARSIHELLNTDLKIIDIACEYNFTYEQSYIRSFINTFNISPDTFRRERPALNIMDRINPETITPIGESGLIFKPVIRIKPQFTIIGIKHKINITDNLKTQITTKYALNFYYNHSHRIKNPRFPHRYIGFTEIVKDKNEYKYYTTSVEATSLDNIPEGMTGLTIPTHKYAVFKYTGMHHAKYTTANDLLDMYKYIFDVWLGGSDYNIAGQFHIESVDMSIDRDDYCELEFYVPVRHRL